MKVHDWPQWQDGEWLLCMAPGLRGRRLPWEAPCRKAHGSSGCRAASWGSTLPPGYDGPARSSPGVCAAGQAGVPSRCHLSCCRQPPLLVVNYFLSQPPLRLPSFCNRLLVSLIFCFLDEVQSSSFCPVGSGWVSTGMGGSLSRSLRWGARLTLCPLADTLVRPAEYALCPVISRTQARFSARLQKLSWVQLKFLEHVAFSEKKERHCCFVWGERPKCWDPDSLVYFWLDEKLPFCFSWGNVIILTVIGEHKAVSWAEEWVLWKMD